VGTAWYDTVPHLIDEIQALERSTRQNKEQSQLPADVVDLVSKANALVHEKDNKLKNIRKTKKRRLLESNNSGNSTNSRGVGSERSDGCDEESKSRIDGNNGNESSAPEQSKSGPKPPQLAPGFNIWWDSMCAQRLFNSSKERETVVDRL
jgi:hypothetical protein